MQRNVILTLWVFFIMIPVELSAQQEISGFVFDASNLEPLHFANIGIVGKNRGTTSAVNGFFRLSAADLNQTDSLAVSFVGYRTQFFSVQQLLNSSEQHIKLEPAGIDLEELVVSASGDWRTRRFGSRGLNPIAFGVVQSADLLDIAECAQRIRLPEHGARLESFHVYLRNAKVDTAAFRLNFYRYDGEPLAERAFERELLFRENISRGWLELDLSAHQIWLSGDILATIEFLPDDTQQEAVSFYYGGVVRSKGTSYKRTSSHGEWEKLNVGTYAMYVRATYLR